MKNETNNFTDEEIEIEIQNITRQPSFFIRGHEIFSEDYLEKIAKTSLQMKKDNHSEAVR